MAVSVNLIEAKKHYTVAVEVSMLKEKNSLMICYWDFKGWLGIRIEDDF